MNISPPGRTEFDGRFRQKDGDSSGTTGVWKLRLPDLSVWDWYAFCLSFGAWLSFRIGGTLFGSDFLLLLGVPILLSTKIEVLSYKPVLRILILGALWLCSQVITDVIRGTLLEDFSRGWLKIIFTLAHFCIIWVLIHNSKRRVILYAVGLMLATILRSITYKTDAFQVDPWKFGYAFPASMAVLLLVTFLMRREYSFYHLLPLTGLAMLNVWEGYRSQAFVLMITIVVTHGYKSLGASGRTLSKTKLAGLAFAVLVASVAANVVYSYAASHLWLGEKSYKKYEAQGGSAAGVLIGGRSEILASTAAVADSPWIGHGSWAKDPKYLWVMVMRLRELGYTHVGFDESVEEAAQNGTIPSHSHIMAAWVEAGLLGAVFWVYVLYLMVRFLLTLNGQEAFLPLAMFQITLLVWDILFSPFGAERRFSVTFFLALLLAISYQKERQQARLRDIPEHSPRAVLAGFS